MGGEMVEENRDLTTSLIRRDSSEDYVERTGKFLGGDSRFCWRNSRAYSIDGVLRSISKVAEMFLLIFMHLHVLTAFMVYVCSGS